MVHFPIHDTKPLFSKEASDVLYQVECALSRVSSRMLVALVLSLPR